MRRNGKNLNLPVINVLSEERDERFRYPSAKNSIGARGSWTASSVVSRPSSNGGLDADSNGAYPDYPHTSHSQYSTSRFSEPALYDQHLPPQHSPYFPEGSLSNSLSDPYGTPSSSEFTPSEESPRSGHENHWSDHTDPYSSTTTLRPIDISILG